MGRRRLTPRWGQTHFSGRRGTGPSLPHLIGNKEMMTSEKAERSFEARFVGDWMTVMSFEKSKVTVAGTLSQSGCSSM
jgi:hypothetical protein